MKLRSKLKQKRCFFDLYNHYLEIAANAILKEALAIARKKATVDGRGNYVATPSIPIYKTENVAVKAGKFYRKGNDDVFIGVEAEFGKEGRQTVLYPVDTVAIKKQGFTFEYVNKED